MLAKPDLSTAHAARLQRIADLLDQPVEAFFGASASDALEDTCALIRFWTAVDDVRARRRILSFARQEARRAGYVEDPVRSSPAVPWSGHAG